jgi:hypothetical protein
MFLFGTSRTSKMMFVIFDTQHNMYFIITVCSLYYISSQMYPETLCLSQEP